MRIRLFSLYITIFIADEGVGVRPRFGWAHQPWITAGVFTNLWWGRLCINADWVPGIDADPMDQPWLDAG